jgi:hypothetical protein
MQLPRRINPSAIFGQCCLGSSRASEPGRQRGRIDILRW